MEEFRQKFTSFKSGSRPTGEGSGHVLSPDVWAYQATDWLRTTLTERDAQIREEEREHIIAFLTKKAEEYREESTKRRKEKHGHATAEHFRSAGIFADVIADMLAKNEDRNP